MEIFNIAEGWRAVRYPNERVGLDRLALEVEGAPGQWREVWWKEIPPKMDPEELASEAAMYAALYDTAWNRGIEFAKKAFLTALDNLDLLGGEAV